jgi:hypothetical protein
MYMIIRDDASSKTNQESTATGQREFIKPFALFY